MEKIKTTQSDNPFSQLPVKSQGGGVEVAAQRAVQEVQAALVIAKKFPRDEFIGF